MSKDLTIRFEHLKLQSIEGQLLMAACRMHTNSTEIAKMDEYLAQLQEVHDELCFTKELIKVIKDV